VLNAIIHAALTHRWITLAIALAVLGIGGWSLVTLPIDVFPDLNRPRVTVITEAHGLAPEEVEAQVTFPIEAALNGSPGVLAVRSSSAMGVSIVHAEFDWSTNLYVDRQIVAEKLGSLSGTLPEGMTPMLAPISSVIGQILMVGLWSESGETSAAELRTLADWVIRPRVLSVPGVTAALVMGGDRKQYQVLVNPEALSNLDVTLTDVERALSAGNANATGGYLVQEGREFLVRSLGRVQSRADLEQIVVRPDSSRSVVLSQVARVVEGAQVKRGDASINGHSGVVLIVSKQPGADTRRVTDQVEASLAEIRQSLPKDVRLDATLYQQKTFIDLSIRNVIEAIRDGGILVVIILLLFLHNLRTTFITLTAIPLSIVTTGLVFHWTGMSINTMTLGGLAVAIGELVDDAIVDIENIFRRLRENAQLAQPRSVLRVIYEASCEVRNSVVFSTLLVILVFLPLFALDGIEGRLFTPLAIAYIVSIMASLLVSLTVTPVLAYWLLPTKKFLEHAHDGLVVRVMKAIASRAIRFSLRFPRFVLIVTALAVIASGLLVARMGRDFLPPFNEGTVQVNLFVPPGSSLPLSNELAGRVERSIMAIPGVQSLVRRTGRAELDEHAESVSTSELIVSLDRESPRSREEILTEIRAAALAVPGVSVSAEQPLQHAISHMLTGVKSAVGMKLFGDDLPTLRRFAEEMRAAIATVPGVTDLLVEPQVEVEQVQFRVRRDRLRDTGLSVQEVNELIETAINGREVSTIFEGQRRFDLVVRLDDEYRNDLARLERLAVLLPDGGRVPLSSVADMTRATGPNGIQRENVRRRILLQCNASGRDVGGVVDDIRARLAPVLAELPVGYYVEFGGQFDSQARATRTIGWLSLGSLLAMFLLLFTLFGSVSCALQVLSALPMAAIGAVLALHLTNQSLTVASLVGFISLGGIASRNGILLVTHYLHLVRQEGEVFSREMIERAGLERMSPMLMTALTAGIALIPLVLAAGEPGREILHPVATVIVGGLVSSTLLDFFVHPALFWLFGRVICEQTPNSDEAL
jgi:CzcA family heavy metal efflux pump